MTSTNARRGFLVFVIGIGLLLAACTPIATETPASGESSGEQVANPASQYCTEQGGTLSIETRGDGGQYGVCTFEDNLQCEEWAMMRGNCPVGGIKVTGYVTDAARYCAITGGQYQADEAATTDADQEQGTCTLPDGQSCDVWGYFDGSCGATDESGDVANTPTAEPAQEGSPDPFAYCASVGTEDSPPDETVDGELPTAVVQAMIDQNVISADAPAAIQQAAQWRCMGGNVWVCVVGANLPCDEKADTSDAPTSAMNEYCQSNSGADSIPAVTTGRATVYSWKCDGTTAAVDKQVFTVDAQGFLSEIWTELVPPQ